jgi:hypothetical protein
MAADQISLETLRLDQVNLQIYERFYAAAAHVFCFPPPLGEGGSSSRFATIIAIHLLNKPNNNKPTP